MQWFHVFNKPNDNGFHPIKNEKGETVAEAASTDDEQIRVTLEQTGVTGDFDYEFVYDDALWEAVGKS